ncbi:GIY-YIG nuclease family protein [Neobacillus vireti]|uniref:GIY-YIG nuclease family protein n=1 Tax=Neobacillus vireti TaxID=220686 RepID=UPI002FFE0914
MKYGGIYVIFNLFNNKFYIGSSKNIYNRLNEHFRKLKQNNHHNIHLQRAYNKHSDFFISFLLEKVDHCDDLLIREQYWIDELNACNDGYNILPTAGNNSGYKHSDEVKRKISQSNKGKKLSEETIAKMKDRKITSETKRKLSEIHIGMKHSKETKKKISESQYISVKQLSKDGELIKIWDSMTTAQNEGGFTKAHISKCCLGKRKTHGGFMWEFA